MAAVRREVLVPWAKVAIGDLVRSFQIASMFLLGQGKLLMD